MNSKQITDEIMISLKWRKWIFDWIDDDILEEISDEIQLIVENWITNEEV